MAAWDTHYSKHFITDNIHCFRFHRLSVCSSKPPTSTLAKWKHFSIYKQDKCIQNRYEYENEILLLFFLYGIPGPWILDKEYYQSHIQFKMKKIKSSTSAKTVFSSHNKKLWCFLAQAQHWTNCAWFSKTMKKDNCHWMRYMPKIKPVT